MPEAQTSSPGAEQRLEVVHLDPDAALGRALGRDERGDVTAQVVTRDLPGRPPERLHVQQRGLILAAADLGLEVTGRVPGEEQASEHRPERLRADRGAGERGD